ncbi:MAG: hypothetical protein H6815_04010 [Phycisphaeraceae bacterium]|nr:hypothetical protein [Phycisphaerales bacterium]MCB9859595.1 hypothetical protein [Phycisphaeraceae bacterium]
MARIRPFSRPAQHASRKLRLGTSRSEWTPAPMFMQRWLSHPYLIAGGVMAFSLALGTYPRAAETTASTFDPESLLLDARQTINESRAVSSAQTRFTGGLAADSMATPAEWIADAAGRADNAFMADKPKQSKKKQTEAVVKPDAESPLPIRRITLYRSGVGAFERRGTVTDDQTVSLNFRTDQINDMLKSMVLLDLDGGSVQSVRYGSREPLERRLAAFGLNISDQPSLPELASRLRGSKVRIRLSTGDTLTGTVFGRENRKTITGSDGNTTDMPAINLLVGTSLRSIDVNSVAEFEILDAELQRELEMALGAIAEQRSENMKTVDVSFTGNGDRQVIASYIHEMPVWKTSYRLVLPEIGAAGSDGLMQGWAIVENTTDEDWTDVRLALVSGRPVGFEMDLYEPLYLDRPEIDVPVLAGVMPKVFDGADLDRAAEKMVAKNSMREERARTADARAGASLSMPAGLPAESFSRSNIEQDMLDKLSHSTSAAASGRTDGEVFKFELDTPVTIERQRSAMIPIIAEEIEARRVSIYSAGDDHPMKGVEIINSSGLQIIPGPIAVYDGSTYAGDAQIGHVPADDKRLLAFAVDLDVDARTEYKSARMVRKLRVVKGVVEQTVENTITTTYRLDNKDSSRDRTVIIEHAKMLDWELVDAKPTETTANAYRFEVDLGKSKSGTIDVKLAQTVASSYALTNFNIEQLQTYVRDGKAPKEIVDAFREAGRLQNTVNLARQRLTELNSDRETIATDQSRIRQNMSSIDRNTELYRRYMTKLNDQETQIERIVNDIAKAQQDIQTAEKALRDYLGSLNIG